MQKIDAQPDFASMKESMAGIQRIARSDRAHARAMTNLIHDDTAMVSKLLRLINAAYYSSVGGGSITSLQRAVSLLGFKSVGLLASSLMLFERLPKGADGERLRREFARAQLATLLAHDLCHSRNHIEDIYIAALFQRLGPGAGTQRRSSPSTWPTGSSCGCGPAPFWCCRWWPMARCWACCTATSRSPGRCS